MTAGTLTYNNYVLKQKRDSGEPKMARNKTILIVDDDRIQVEVIRTLLETEGFDVCSAINGKEALYHLQTNKIDLILSDIAMPEMNGYQLFEEVSAHALWHDIPFIFLTARDMNSDIRFGKSLGVDDYLLKPISAADLLATVEGKLRRCELKRKFTNQRPVSASSQSDSSFIEVGQLRIDPKGHRVWFGERLVSVSAREFALLLELAVHKQEILSAQQLVKVTHQLETDPRDAGMLIRPLIRSVRRKLGFSAGETGCIENVRGVGYRLIPL
ncbi:MAG: response regulator transcription factor [Candidatus Promineifilaceae bacterium]